MVSPLLLKKKIWKLLWNLETKQSKSKPLIISGILGCMISGTFLHPPITFLYIYEGRAFDIVNEWEWVITWEPTALYNKRLLYWVLGYS